MAEIGTEISIACQLIQTGQTVGVPTETVYGLAADALNPQAVARIFAIKERPHFDPLIVHLPELSWLDRVAVNTPSEILDLAETFWPGPLTLILQKSSTVPDLVTSGLETVAVRIPNHPLTRELIFAADCPLAAPSANLFGRISPTTANHVSDQLGDRIDYILDGGPCTIGIESTIIHVLDDQIQILRPGGITQEQLQSAVGSSIKTITAGQSNDKVTAPGQIDQHYAPRTPLKIFMNDFDVPEELKLGLLAFQPDCFEMDFVQSEFLTTNGNLEVAAANFFSALRRLDEGPVDLILATGFPEQGLGVALNDRLRRAAHD